GVLFPNERRGAVELLLVPYVGGAPQVLIEGSRQVLGAAFAGGALVATVADPASFGEVATVRDGRLQVLTDFGARLRDATEVLPMQEITASAPDGYPVHGWVVRPAGDGPHPVLLM